MLIESNEQISENILWWQYSWVLDEDDGNSVGCWDLTSFWYGELSILRAACAAAKIDKWFWSLWGITAWALVFNEWWV